MPYAKPPRAASLYSSSATSAPRQRVPKAQQPQGRQSYRSWANFDPYLDNVGCVIRVARRPSSLIAPPKAMAIIKSVPEPFDVGTGGGTSQEADALALVVANKPQLPSSSSPPPPPPPPAVLPPPSQSAPEGGSSAPADDDAVDDVGGGDIAGGADAANVPPPPTQSDIAALVEAAAADEAGETFLGLPKSWLAMTAKGAEAPSVPLLPRSPLSPSKAYTSASCTAPHHCGTGGGGAAIDDVSGLSPEAKVGGSVGGGAASVPSWLTPSSSTPCGGRDPTWERRGRPLGRRLVSGGVGARRGHRRRRSGECDSALLGGR